MGFRNQKGKTTGIISVLILLLLLTCIAYAVKNKKLSNDTGISDSELDDLTVMPEITATQAPTLSPTPVVTPTTEPTPTPTPLPTPEPTIQPGPTEPVPETLDDLKKSLEEYIAQQKGRYGLYYINLVTGEEFGINDKERYIAASTTKLPMNLLLYRKVASGEVDLNDKLVYLEEDFEPGTGIIQKSSYGTEYTVRETARLSIVYSDNCGINMIIRLLGIENIRKYMQDIGGTIYYGRDHRTCPYDLAVYARELYRFYQEEPEIAGLLIEDLQNTMWNDRINKLLPEDVKVSHKIGNYDGVYNDVGIVFAEEPYALAIMSENINQSVASDVIAQMSKRIYDYVVAASKSKSN